MRKEFKKIEKEDIKWFAVVLIFTSFSIAPIVYAYRFLEIGTSSFLFYASFTIFTYIFGFMFFKEKVNLVKIISLILSIAGLLLIFTLKLNLALLIPIAMAILNGLASSGEVTFSKKISEKYSNTQIVFLVFFCIAISHVFLSLILNERQDIKLFTDSGFILLTFAVSAIIGMVTVIQGFKFVEPSIGSLIGLMEIVFSVLFGIFLFKENLSLNILIGGVLITLAAALPSIIEYLKMRLGKNQT